LGSKGNEARQPRRGRRLGRPKKKYSQAERTLQLYDRLHRGQTLRASTLARELSVDRRTLQRDLGVLSEVLQARGTPLERVADPEPGVRLPNPGKRWTTTRWQVLAVALGARLSGFLSGERFATQVAPLLSQLQASLPAAQALDVHELQRKLHVVEAGQKLYRKNPASQGCLAAMLDALLLDLPLELTYRSRSPGSAPGGTVAMRVHVRCMTAHRGAVYFVVDGLGGERHVGERVLLALDRVASATMDSSAQRLPSRPAFDAAAFFESAFGVWTGEETHRVRLWIDPSYAWAVQERSWHPTQTLTALPDGSLRLELVLGELREVADWVLGMGEHCRVERPPALRTLVTERLRAALGAYDPSASATYSVAPPAQSETRRRNEKPSREK